MLLFPLVGGAFFCTGCIPPHMETPTATGETKAPKQRTPDKMHDLLKQHDATPTAEEDSHQPSAASSAVELDDACFMLPDCPVDEPDKAAFGAREFEKQFQHHVPKHKHDDKKRSSIASSPPVARSKDEEETSTEKTSGKDIPHKPDLSQNRDINRLVELVELGSTVFAQNDQYYNLQAVNAAFPESSMDGMMFAQQFSAPQTLEMLQDGTSHSIQAINYVGVDFTT